MQSPAPHSDLSEVTQERQHTVKQTTPQWKGWKIADPSPDPVHRIEKKVFQREAPPPASMRVPLPVAYQNVDHGHEVFEHGIMLQAGEGNDISLTTTAVLEYHIR